MKICANKHKIKVLFILLFSFFIVNSFAQGRKDLQAKMNKTKKEIEYTNTLIKQTEKSKKQSLNKLQLLNKKIALRKKYVEALNEEIVLLSMELEQSQKNLYQLEKDLQLLKQEYALMIYNAYKNRSSQEKLMFILSSEDFNQAYKRLKYLQQYSEHRNQQIVLIQSTQDSIKLTIANKERLINDKKNLLTEKEKEKTKLNSEKSQQSTTIKNLEKKKKELIATLKKKEKQANELNDKIQKLIEEERKKEALNAAKSKEGKIISDKFGENKGRLPWPTNGVITSSFGEHPHPVLKGIKIKNNGVDISTQTGGKARAIFEGTVSKVIVIPGSNSAILVRHGDYLSVYNNLIEIAVKPGQKVKANQVLGTIYTDDETGKTTLQLQIWKETTKMNPEDWLVK